MTADPGTCTVLAALIMLVALLAAGWSRRSPRRDPHRRPASRRDVGDDVGMIDVVERTARDARSGVALRVALLNALHLHPAVLPAVRDQLDRGAPIGLALADADIADGGDTAFVLHGVRLAAETGGAVADTLDRVVTVVRERRTWRGERHAQAAQARLSARILTVLPLAVACVAVATGPRVRHAYAQSPATGVTTAVGVALNLTGWWWMRCVVRGPRGR